VLFNSLTFIAFAIVVYAGWAVVHARLSTNACCGYLVAASLVFYGWTNHTQVVCLIAVALASWGCGRLARGEGNKRVLGLGLACAIGPLLVYKYLDFALAPFGVPELGFTIPLGLSFYTLSAASYAIDVYSGELAATDSLVEHTAYLTLFPALISGPIMRGAQILPQLRERRLATEQMRWEGTKRITYGLVKKVIVADTLSGFTSGFYDDNIQTSSAVWWLVAALFAIQVYCDFSGYTDIAIGLGKWLGLELPENFDRPFYATSIRDYWNRWNISFTTWLRDYIYFPLARRWATTLGAIAAVIVTFLVSGLWHGAAWTFVVWGLGHGVLLCLESWTQWDRRIRALPGGRVLASVLVFFAVAMLMILFRSRDLAQAGEIYKTMFSFKAPEYSWLGREEATFDEPMWFLIPIAFVLVELRHAIGFDGSRLATALRRTNLGWLGIAVLLLACVYLRGHTKLFIYAAF
jgi:alginate O-acetyltransferase complex protein AlgI